MSIGEFNGVAMPPGDRRINPLRMQAISGPMLIRHAKKDGVRRYHR